MNPEIKARWIAALRSGEYVQGTCLLRASRLDGVDRFCCLGVLCDLAAQSGVVSWAMDGDYALESEGGQVQHLNEVLPYPVMKWAGLDSTNPVVRSELLDRTEANPYGATELAELNDRHGHSFLQLADCIEVSL